MAIEYAIKTDTSFVPSPKKRRTHRTLDNIEEGDAYYEMESANTSKMPGGFGLELTNAWNASPFKGGSPLKAGSPVKPVMENPLKAGSPLKRRLFEPDSPAKRLRFDKGDEENIPGALAF
jgi:hypothetical protein